MEKPIFIALDVPRMEDADKLLNQLPENVSVKIGMELFYHYGSLIVEHLKNRNDNIFLDLKLFDIPNTVQQGMEQLARLGVDYVTVNSLGGAKMISAAKQGLLDGGNATKNKIPKLLAVTELTSLSSEQLANEQNCKFDMVDQVVSLAKMAKKAGADGVITSPLEVKALKQKVGKDFLYITPGIRLKNNEANDQSRIATPKIAKENGSTGLVIGRPITKSDHPAETYQKILEEWK